MTIERITCGLNYFYRIRNRPHKNKKYSVINQFANRRTYTLVFKTTHLNALFGVAAASLVKTLPFSMLGCPWSRLSFFLFTTITAAVVVRGSSGGGSWQQWCLGTWWQHGGAPLISIQRWWMVMVGMRDILQLARDIFGIGDIRQIHGSLRNGGGVSNPDHWWFPPGRLSSGVSVCGCSGLCMVGLGPTIGS